MAKTMCPGQDTMFWTPGDIFEIPCAECGFFVEFFKDDAKRRCPRCGHQIRNPKLNVGCAQWCEHAKDCLGFDPKEAVRLTDKEEKALVDSLISAMKQKFGEDQKRIAHALMVLERAQEIMIKEGGEPRVVLAAAVLHDIGIHEAERKYNSTAGRYHQKEGPPVAREILSTLGAGEALIGEVCDIVGHHHHPRDEETLSFKIVYDADLIVNLEEHQKDREIEREKLSEIVEKKMLTDSGKRLAREALFEQER